MNNFVDLLKSSEVETTDYFLHKKYFPKYKDQSPKTAYGT
jgi:hypothetical protein